MWTYAGAWELLFADRDAIHVFPNLSCAFEACDGYVLVLWRGQPVGVDDGHVVHVGRADGDVAAGEGCDECGRDGGVVVAVDYDIGSTVVSVVA